MKNIVVPADYVHAFYIRLMTIYMGSVFNHSCLYVAMLQEVIDAADGANGASEEKSEMEELKQLLPDIKEKVEDAKESQRTASVASQAIQQTLVSTATKSSSVKIYWQDEDWSRSDWRLNLSLVGQSLNIISIPA